MTWGMFFRDWWWDRYILLKKVKNGHTYLLQKTALYDIAYAYDKYRSVYDRSLCHTVAHGLACATLKW